MPFLFRRTHARTKPEDSAPHSLKRVHYFIPVPGLPPIGAVPVVSNAGPAVTLRPREGDGGR